MKVGVIGAGGHVGSVLVDELERRCDIEVVAVVRNGLAARVLNPPRAEVRVGSVTNTGDALRLLGDCDAVVNAALPRGSNRDMRRANDAILSNMARLPRAVALVHFSSIAVYGSRIGISEEDARPRPETAYGTAKLKLERHAARVLPGNRRRHYILRVGHVYGAGQWLSEEILGNAQRVGFGLPFEGRTPANAVWVRTVAAVIHRIVTEPPASGTYDVTDDPNRGWRHLYDRHTSAVGLPPVGDLDDEHSRAMSRVAAARERAAVLVGRALRASLGTAGSSMLTAMPPLRVIADPMLAVLPDWVEYRVRHSYVRARVRADIARLAPAIPALPPWLFSSAVPGPYLAPASGAPAGDDAGAAGQFARELSTWYRTRTSHRWAANLLA